MRNWIRRWTPTAVPLVIPEAYANESGPNQSSKVLAHLDDEELDEVARRVSIFDKSGERARYVLQQFDPEAGSVVVLQMPEPDIESLSMIRALHAGIREVAPDGVLIVLDPSASIAVVPEEEMKRNGWLKESTVRGYLDDAIRSWRDTKIRALASGNSEEAAGTASHYVDAYQSVRVSLLGEPLRIDA